MKFFNPVYKKSLIIVGMMVVIGGLLGLTPNYAKAADHTSPASKDKNVPSLSQPSIKELKSWRSSIRHLPLPKKGCFKAEYPQIKWHEVPCTKAPPWPYRPAKGLRPYQIGNGNDAVAVTTNPISESIGSFDSVTGVQNVYGTNPYTGTMEPNIFSLQLNSNVFIGASVCDGRSGCYGWAQFVYSNSGGQAFIQYWLINYGSTCPTSGGPASGWYSFEPYASDCYGNSNAVSVAGAPINVSQLATMSVSGQAVTGGNDTIVFYVDNAVYSVSESDSVVNLADYWQQVEFNVFGDGGGTEATFNYEVSAVAALQVRISVDIASTNAPSCFATGYTGETNNLYFGGAPTNPSSGNKPALVFTETSTNNSYTACEYAVSVADTHLMTFSGLFYDFQATGDFVLTEVGSDFIVQARQAPPVGGVGKNTTINKAVGVQMGETRVALYVGPTRLMIDGKPYTLADKKPIVINGVQISRKGDNYLMVSPSGDSVMATVNNNMLNPWINVAVGLGRSKGEAHGLLGSLEGNVYKLVTRSGTVLKSPVSFNDLYNIYGESWRVKPNEMLLEDDPMVKFGVPEKPFYVSDLKQKEAARVIAICKAAGINDNALIEACALDTAVLGDSKKTVKPYVHAVVPRAVLPKLTFKP